MLFFFLSPLISRCWLWCSGYTMVTCLAKVAIERKFYRASQKQVRIVESVYPLIHAPSLSSVLIVLKKTSLLWFFFLIWGLDCVHLPRCVNRKLGLERWRDAVDEKQVVVSRESLLVVQVSWYRRWTKMRVRQRTQMEPSEGNDRRRMARRRASEARHRRSGGKRGVAMQLRRRRRLLPRRWRRGASHRRSHWCV